MSADDGARERTTKVFEHMPPGDPAHTADAVLRLVDAAEPPLRVIFGEHAFPMVRDACAARLDEWARWSALGDAAQ